MSPEGFLDFRFLFGDSILGRQDHLCPQKLILSLKLSDARERTADYAHKKLKLSLSTESFLIFLLFSIVIRIIAYCSSVVIGRKLSTSFL